MIEFVIKRNDLDDLILKSSSKSVAGEYIGFDVNQIYYFFASIKATELTEG